VVVAKRGGNVAKVALRKLESKTGNKLITSLSAENILEQKNLEGDSKIKK
jgi:hypothetical protein